MEVFATWFMISTFTRWYLTVKGGILSPGRGTGTINPSAKRSTIKTLKRTKKKIKISDLNFN
jgi:hypothetical protein